MFLQQHSVSLAWRLDREMRRRLILLETGFTRQRFFIYFLLQQRWVFFRIFTFYLFLNWFTVYSCSTCMSVSDDQKYICGRRLYPWINTQKFKGLDSGEITSLPEIKKWFTWYVISIIAENQPHSHHKTHLHTIKVYNTRPSQFC